LSLSLSLSFTVFIFIKPFSIGKSSSFYSSLKFTLSTEKSYSFYFGSSSIPL